MIKKLKILDNTNYVIVKHHIKNNELSFECTFDDDESTITFLDDYTYNEVKQFIKSLNIKTTIVKGL